MASTEYLSKDESERTRQLRIWNDRGLVRRLIVKHVSDGEVRIAPVSHLDPIDLMCRDLRINREYLEPVINEALNLNMIEKICEAEKFVGLRYVAPSQRSEIVAVSAPPKYGVTEQLLIDALTKYRFEREKGNADSLLISEAGIVNQRTGQDALKRLIKAKEVARTSNGSAITAVWLDDGVERPVFGIERRPVQRAAQPVSTPVHPVPQPPRPVKLTVRATPLGLPEQALLRELWKVLRRSDAQAIDNPTVESINAQLPNGVAFSSFISLNLLLGHPVTREVIREQYTGGKRSRIELLVDYDPPSNNLVTPVVHTVLPEPEAPPAEPLQLAHRSQTRQEQLLLGLYRAGGSVRGAAAKTEAIRVKLLDSAITTAATNGLILKCRNDGTIMQENVTPRERSCIRITTEGIVMLRRLDPSLPPLGYGNESRTA